MLVLILSLSRPLVVRLRFGFLLPPGVLPLLSCSAPFSFSVPLRLSSQLFADPRIGPLFILKTEPPRLVSYSDLFSLSYLSHLSRLRFTLGSILP